jgi:hypothetical protein
MPLCVAHSGWCCANTMRSKHSCRRSLRDTLFARAPNATHANTANHPGRMSHATAKARAPGGTVPEAAARTRAPHGGTPVASTAFEHGCTSRRHWQARTPPPPPPAAALSLGHDTDHNEQRARHTPATIQHVLSHPACPTTHMRNSARMHRPQQQALAGRHAASRHLWCVLTPRPSPLARQGQWCGVHTHAAGVHVRCAHGHQRRSSDCSSAAHNTRPICAARARAL